MSSGADAEKSKNSKVQSNVTFLVRLYDVAVYRPLEAVAIPLFAKLPRKLFGINAISAVGCQILRCLTVFPFMWYVKAGRPWMAFLTMLIHDFLDHLDGIIQKVRSADGEGDDEKLSSFLDSFCDKIICVVNLWTLLVAANTNEMWWPLQSLFVGLTMAGIIYELLLAIIRVDDYYPAPPGKNAAYARYGGAGPLYLASSMEAKLKEKLISLTIGLLALSMPSVFNTFSGWLAMCTLSAVIYLDQANFRHKWDARNKVDVEENPISHSRMVEREGLTELPTDDEVLPEEPPYEVVYTIGCFDLFHDGHKRLMRRLRAHGKQVVVGVHDDESIYLLKNRYPVDNQVKRMRNVRRYADRVYIIPSTDPTPYLEAAIDRDLADKSAYMRGNDMQQFPGRELIERAGIEIIFFPYTQGVSSTMKRQELTARRAAQVKQAGSLSRGDRSQSHMCKDCGIFARTSLRIAHAHSVCKPGYRWIRVGHQWLAADDSWIRYGDEFIKMA